MHDTEREIIKITKYVVKRKFADRQDYLKSLFTAVQKLTDDDFDDLTDGAAIWANACVEAHNSQRDGDLPDFDEVGDEGEDEDTVDEAPDDEEADDEPEDDEADPEDDEVVDDVGDDDADPDEEVGEPDSEDAEEPPEDDEPVEIKKPAKKAAKAAKPVEVKAPKVKTEPKIKQKPVNLEEDVVLDKWGCMEGSKNSQALGLFEKGATAREIKDAIGGTYYNILRKMVEQGHKLEKNGAVIKITHLMEKAAKVPAAKKAKK